jgi:O-antigen/teichoic acid export membrane protein
MDPTRALLLEAGALAVTAALLLRARAQHTASDTTATPPERRAVFASIYSVGMLALLDVVIFRRLEVYFLERSPDGLAGVAVLGLALQIATVALLVPTALLEAWQPRFALAANGSEQTFEKEVARYGRVFAWMMIAIVAVGAAVPLIAIPFAFPHYQAWTGYIVALVAIRIACAGAGFFSSVMYATGRHNALYPSAVVAAVVAVCGNALLTSRLGLRGALIAYGLTQLTLAVLTVVAFRRSRPRQTYRVELADLTPIQETGS